MTPLKFLENLDLKAFRQEGRGYKTITIPTRDVHRILDWFLDLQNNYDEALGLLEKDDATPF